MAAQSVAESAKLMNENLSPADKKEVQKAMLRQQVTENTDHAAIGAQVARYSQFLNSDPRTLKRFANLLRFYHNYQVLRMKNKQKYIPLQYLGKYLALMLKFPQLIRWLQWDSENKEGISANAGMKARMIDDAVGQFIQYEHEAQPYRYWQDAALLEKSTKPNDAIRLIIQLHEEFPWLRSQSLLNILLSERGAEGVLGNALSCNVW